MLSNRTCILFVFILALVLKSDLIMAAADIYEDDDAMENAHPIVINKQEPQERTIHDEGDSDWVKFYGISGESYAFRVTVAKEDPAESEMYAYIGLYNAEGVLLDEEFPIGLLHPNEKETLTWPCIEDGFYFVEIRNKASTLYGENCNYRLTAFDPSLANYPSFASCTGAITWKGIPQLNAIIKAKHAVEEALKGAGLTSGNGGYGLEMPGGDYDMEVIVGNCKLTTQFRLEENATNNLSVEFGSGDISGNRSVELEDELIILQLLAGKEPPVENLNLSGSLEEGCEGPVGLDEAILVLKKLAEL